MAGKYLKGRKLAKEMEKKAKQTAEKKEKAKEEIERAEELLEESKELGIDVESIEGRIEEARDSFDEKDFEETTDMIEGVLEDLREANNERMEDLLNRIKDIHDMIDDEDLESHHVLDDCEELLDNDKFMEAMDKGTQALDLAGDEMEGVILEERSDIEERINTLEDWGEDLSEVKEDLEDISEVLDEGEYKETYSILEEARENSEKGIHEIIADRVEKLEGRAEGARDEGLDTSKIEELLSDAKSHDEKDFEETMKILDDADSRFQDLTEELVEKNIDKLEKEIEEAEDINVPKDKVRGINEQIEKLKEGGSFDEIYELIENIFEELEDAKFQQVLETIAQSREDFIKAKEIGTDISGPMNILNQARDSLKDGRYKEALDKAEEGREKVEELIADHKRVERSIEDFEKTNMGLNDLGIEIDDIDQLIEDANSALEEKDYDKATETLDEIEGLLDKRGYEEIMALIEELEFTVLTTQEVGLEHEEYNENLNEAIDSAQDGDYVKAGRIAIEWHSKGVEYLEEELSSSFENIEDLVDKIEKELKEEAEEEELKEVEELKDEAKDERSEENYREAFRTLEDAQEKIKEWQVGGADEQISKAEDILDLLESLDEDIEIKSYRGRVEEAKRKMDEEKYDEAMKEGEDIEEELKSHLDPDQYFDDAKIEVVKAKKSGVDIEELRNRLVECKKNIKKGDQVEAVRIAVQAEEEAKELRKGRKEAHALLSDATDRLKKLKRQGVNGGLSEAQETLVEGKNNFQNDNYSRAIKLGKKAEKKLDDIENLNKFNEKRKEVKQLISKAESLSVGTEEIRGRFSTIKEEKEEKGAERNIELLEELKDDMHSLMKASVKPRLEKTKGIIDSAEQIGVDLSEQKELLKEAEKSLEGDRYEESIDKIIECQDQIEEVRNKSKKAAEKVKDTREKMNEAKDLHAEVGSAEKKIEDSMEDLKNDRYDEAMKKCEIAEKTIRLAKIDRVENILETVQQKITEARNAGLNTSLADNLKNKADKAKDEGNYKKAINLAMQSEGKLERIELQQDIAKRSINTTHDKVKKAEEKNFKIDEAKELLQKSKKVYKGGRYVKAFDMAIESGDKLNKTMKTYENSQEMIDELEEVLKGVEEFDIKIDEAREKFENAKESFENDEYEKSFSLGNQVQSKITEIKEDIPNVIDRVRSKVQELENKGKDIGDAWGELNKAEANLDMDNIADVFEHLRKAKEEYGGDLLDKYEDYIEETVSLIEQAKKFGASLGETEETVNEARDLEDSDIKKAVEKAEEALEKVEEALKPYSPEVEISAEGKVRPDRWNEVEITIKNKGSGVARDPQIEVDAGEIKVLDLPDMIKGDDQVDITAEVKPNGETLSIRGMGARVFDGKLMEDSTDLEVKEGTFEVKKSEGGEKCGICKGKINEGLDMIVCDCGNTYHKPCGERKGECPECGIKFVEEEEEEEEEKEDEEEKEEEKKASKRVALKI